MSLLIIGSANRIAQGVIKQLSSSNLFDKIVCADLYPNYYALQRFINFKSQLTNSSIPVTDIKIEGKTDLSQAIKSSSHILYITHDYYSLVPSKINLIKTVSQLAKESKNIEKFVALTPVEHDHYHEPNPWLTARKSEEEAIEIFPDLVHLKSDITFGPNSTVANILLSRIVNNQNVAFDPRLPNEEAYPIHTDDIAKAVETAFKNKKIKGKAFALQGTEKVTLGEYLSILQKYTGNAIKLNEDFIEKTIPPYHQNLISERIYDDEYRNLTNFFREYRALETSGLESASGLKLKPKELSSTYPAKEIDESLYKEEELNPLERLIKKFLYQ